jgi:hypothetical protein
MKTRFASVTVGVATLATTGALLLVGAGIANAVTPPYQTSGNVDPNEVGTVAFYNSSGTQITSGSISTAPLAAFYVGSTADAGHTKATQYFYTPKNGVAQGAWPGEQSSLSTTYPNTSAPAPVNGEGNNPVVTGNSSDLSLSDYIADVPNTDTSTTDGYAGLYEVRIKTSTSGQYQAADILVNGTTWTEVFGTPISTATTLTTSGSPSSQGSPVTFTSTTTDGDNSAPAGSVQFFDGTTSLGSATPNSSGVAHITTSALTAAGSPHSITATFTPTAGPTAAFPNFSSSTSNTVTQVIGAPATATTTTLAISGNTTTGTDATLSGTVSPSGAAGSVEFFDGTSTTPLAVTGGPSVPVSSGNYSATLTGGFSQGSHSVVAKFTPTDPSTFAPSQSSPDSFTTQRAGGTCQQTGSQCADVQGIQGEIPTGTLVISTPYTSAQPLDLGTLQLNNDGTLWTANKTFQCITVTDANGVNTGFVAQAQATSLTKTAGPTPPAGAFSSISGENVGLTNLVPSAAAQCQSGAAPVNNYTGGPASVHTTDNSAAVPAVSPTDPGTQGLGNVAHTVISGSPNGVGTVTYDGTLTLNAPTTTAAGTYDGTINFTVSDGE